MTTDPLTLSADIKTCPKDCPFLGGRTFIPDILPYYCDKYDQFLGADKGKKIVRCGHCLGQMINVIQEGLSLIEAYTLPLISIPDTQEAFLGMNRPFQQMFVEVVKKTGHQVALSYGEQSSPAVLADLMLKEWQKAQEYANSPEVKEFKKIVGDLAGDLPNLLDKQTQNLLSNLFQVLDNSERAMLKEILSSPKQAESFLEQVSSMKKDNTLLKNFRLTLYQYDDKNKRRQMESGLGMSPQTVDRVQQRAREDQENKMVNQKIRDKDFAKQLAQKRQNTQNTPQEQRGMQEMRQMQNMRGNNGR